MRKLRHRCGERTIFGLVHGLAFFTISFAGSWLAWADSSSSRPQNPKPVLTIPVKCEIGRSCLVQKLVDHDLGQARRDYRCGTLTTDGHDGIDIRLRTLADMEQGYQVIAAASGTVLRTRDGEPDISVQLRARVDGREAGNGVVVDHGDGWQSQYSHMKRGSILVKPGQQVAPGKPLGLIGMSGNAEFPHLHFSVRHQGITIDPFTASRQGSACDAAADGSGLWNVEAKRALRYNPTAIISVGLSSIKPEKSVISQSNGRAMSNPREPIFLWADVMGAQPGDMQSFTIRGPDNKAIHSQQLIVQKGGLSWFAFIGKRAPASDWPLGRYTGSYSISRKGVMIAEATAHNLMK